MPERYCDIVMKGGITSGVVYPLAAVKLSEHYRFRNVGGTSAGAIAAAAVAAAEHGRGHGRGTGFAELRELPEWLGRNLTSVFQPSRATKPLFAIVLAATAGATVFRKAGGALAAAAAGFPLATLVGALPGLGLAAASVGGGGGFLLVWGLICGIALALAGGALGLLFGIARRSATALPENFFGLLNGYSDEPEKGEPPLTAWLADLLDRLAGKEGDDALTFGDLWGTRELGSERDLNLEMMTTCVTLGRPYRLPFVSGKFWFDPAQFGRLFPARIVDQMVRDARVDEQQERYSPLVPLPEPADLPVVVATRMSLSFPLLISAIPLYGIDYSRPQAERRPEPCWFSDGGICSNFPVHFFDSPVPRWPTFAIDLRKLPRGRKPSDDECENVTMPADNDARGDDWWTRWEERPSSGRLAAFCGSIMRTMQNWVDTTQSHVQGYRDRIVHIEHSHSEGGLNLTMPRDAIERLSARGECGGDLLRSRFALPPETASPLTWENQRWIRYRSFMQLLEETLVNLRTGCIEHLPADRSIDVLSGRGEDEPPEYHWRSREQRDHAQAATSELIELIEQWQRSGESFAPGSPEPAPELRVAPRI